MSRHWSERQWRAKTAIDAILIGKERAYNRVRQCLSDHWRSIGSLQQMCSHYLVDPVACTPASGWEKGQVEKQVGTVRQRFFAPRLRVKSYDELNAWLLDRCVGWAKAQPHPEVRDRTIWEMFEGEPLARHWSERQWRTRPSLIPYAGPFDGFHSVPASPSKTCLVRFDSEEDQKLIQWINFPTNKYSVLASAVGR